MWHHPKYYKELRKLRNKLDQTISQANSTRGLSGVRSGPGLKHQASSAKQQASSESKPEPVQVLQIFNTSLKPQAASIKLQAASYKLHDPGT